MSDTYDRKYVAWRISFQDSEQAARAAFKAWQEVELVDQSQLKEIQAQAVEGAAKELCEFRGHLYHSTEYDEIMDYAQSIRESPQPAKPAVPEKLAIFAKEVLRAARSGADVEGADIFEFASQCGLVELHKINEKCRNDCACADVSDFPVMCYRETDIIASTPQPPEPKE